MNFITLDISRIMEHSDSMERAFFRFMKEKDFFCRTVYNNLQRVVIEEKDYEEIEKTWCEIKIIK